MDERLGRNERRKMLLITALTFAIVYVMWVDPFNWRVFEIILYPLRLFVTYIHEAGHSLAAIGTGGRVIQFVVSLDGSGVATTAGGNRAIILPAGYVGAAMFGALLFFLVNRLPRYAHGLAGGLGVFLIGFSVMFARADASGIPLALFLGVGMGALLFVLAWRASLFLTQLVLNVLAVVTALNAVLDVWFLTRYSDATLGTLPNDAAQFARQFAPLLTPSQIAMIWVGVALLLFGLAVWYGVWKPFTREISETVDRMTDREPSSLFQDKEEYGSGWRK